MVKYYVYTTRKSFLKKALKSKIIQNNKLQFYITHTATKNQTKLRLSVENCELDSLLLPKSLLEDDILERSHRLTLSSYSKLLLFSFAAFSLVMQQSHAAKILLQKL